MRLLYRIMPTIKITLNSSYTYEVVQRVLGPRTPIDVVDNIWSCFQKLVKEHTTIVDVLPEFANVVVVGDFSYVILIA